MSEPRTTSPAAADERLRDAYRRAVAARASADRSGCPSPDALLALVRRDGAEAERLRTLDHVMGCHACHGEFELLRAIERAGGEGVRTTVAQIRWQRYAAVAVAASTLLAVGLGPGRKLWDPERGAVTRGGDADVVLLAPAPSATLGGATPVTFVWRPVAGARRYTVELLTADGALALGGDTGDTTLTLTAPPTLAAGEYRWWVTAQTADGAVSRSAARPLHLRAP